MDHPRVRDQPHRFSCWALPCRSACLRPCSGESGLFLIFCSPSASIRYRSFREQVTSHVSRFPASLTYPTAIALAALCAEPPARAGPDVVSKRAMEALNSGELSSPVVPTAFRDNTSRQAPTASRDKTSRQARMRRCMQSWDPATQMSKAEWRATCRRVIIEQPGMFGPDPL
jgi:hypothetical protein